MTYHEEQLKRININGEYPATVVFSDGENKTNYMDINNGSIEAISYKILSLHSEDERIRKGELIAKVANLKETRTKYNPKRYVTEWGDKTALGLYETFKRIIISE